MLNKTRIFLYIFIDILIVILDIVKQKIESKEIFVR